MHPAQECGILFLSEKCNNAGDDNHMKMEMTPEEHTRIHRRRGRQALGLLIAVLVLIGTLTVLHAGVSAVAKLFDDTAQRQEYEDKLEGLVLFDPVPFDGIENIDDLTLREAAVWGCVYSIQETQGGFEGYNTDPDTEQLLIPSVDVDAYLAKLVGPSFRMTHKTFEMEDMTIEFDDATQCYKIPITGGVGSYRATVTKLFKKGGLLHVTVGYIPTQSADDSIPHRWRTAMWRMPSSPPAVRPRQAPRRPLRRPVRKPSRRPRAQPARRRKDAEENPMSVPYGIGHGIFVYRSILLSERVVYSA